MIELKIEAGSPEALRDTLAAFAAVMGSGLVRSTDEVTMVAIDTQDAQASIEQFVEADPDPEPIGNDSPDRRHTIPAPDAENVPESDTESVPEPQPEPQPQPEPKGKRKRAGKAAAPVPDVEPDPEVLAGEVEPEAEGAVERAEPEPERLVPRTANGKSRPAPIELTLDDLRAAVKRVMDTKGVSETLKRLRRAGYKKASDVPPEDYRAAIQHLLED